MEVTSGGSFWDKVKSTAKSASENPVITHGAAFFAGYHSRPVLEEHIVSPLKSWLKGKEKDKEKSKSK